MPMIARNPWQEEETPEWAAYPYPPRRDTTKQSIAGNYDPGYYLREATKEALELGIAPPEDDSLLGMIEYEYRKSIRNNLKNYFFRKSVWGI